MQAGWLQGGFDCSPCHKTHWPSATGTCNSCAATMSTVGDFNLILSAIIGCCGVSGCLSAPAWRRCVVLLYLYLLQDPWHYDG